MDEHSLVLIVDQDYDIAMAAGIRLRQAEVRRLGIAGCVAKPYRNEDLIATIRRDLNRMSPSKPTEVRFVRCDRCDPAHAGDSRDAIRLDNTRSIGNRIWVHNQRTLMASLT